MITLLIILPIAMPPQTLLSLFSITPAKREADGQLAAGCKA
jgi:hypothetical protein